jgi:thioredoxin 2
LWKARIIAVKTGGQRRGRPDTLKIGAASHTAWVGRDDPGAAVTQSIRTICPHCAAVNRVPVNRLDQSPRCGQCSEPIYTGAPVALDDAGLKRQLERSDQPLLVDFWADWCAPCKMMAPQFAAAAQQLEPLVRLGKLDTESARNSAAEWGIRSIPTLILFAGGQEVARQSGVMQASQIVQWVRSQLS